MNVIARLLYPFADRLPERVRSYLLRRWNPRGRRFLRPNLTFDAFIERLNARKIAYAVLDDTTGKREVLVSDHGSDDTQDLICRWPVGEPIQLYTPSARPGTAYISPHAKQHGYNRIAILPNHLANGVLERAEPMPDGKKVPSACDAFFTRAYRAAYMEGVCCQWSDIESLCASCRTHRYDLKHLASAAGMTLPEDFTLVSLDQILNEHGWRPPGDLLEKAGEWAPWLGVAFPELQFGKRVEDPGVAVFFIREHALANGLKDAIIETLRDNELEPLLILDLMEPQRSLVGREFRGGNWGRGPWNVDGGRPGCIVVTFNLFPVPVPPERKRRRRECDDWKIICTKEAVRDLINRELAPAEQYNALHATDTTDQAWRVIRLIAPSEEGVLRGRIEELRRTIGAAPTGEASNDMTIPVRPFTDRANVG